MNSNDRQLLSIIDSAPIINRLSRADLARLLPHVEIKTYDKGEVLFHQHESVDTMFLLLDGEVKMYDEQQHSVELSSGYFGEELLLDNFDYTTSAEVSSRRCRVLMLQGEEVSRIVSLDPDMIKLFLRSFLCRRAGQKEIEQDNDVKIVKKDKGLLKLFGWLLVCLVPLLIYWGTSQLGITENARTFIAVFLVSIFMWAFKLVPDYVAGMLSILVVLVLGITPSEVVLSGFQSSGFFMAMSIFVLAVIIVDSGLIYRLSLFLLKVTPRSTFAYNLMLTLIGILFTPILPSANGRVGLITPLLKDLVTSLKFEHRGTDANRMALSAFFGVSLFSSLFLTSKAINFLVFAMLSIQVQDNFQWIDWAEAAAITGLTLLMLFLLFCQIFFRGKSTPSIDRRQISLQLTLLGNFSLKEWGALLGILMLIMGVVTTSVHKIKPAWIGLAIMLVFLALGVLSKKSFKEKIDWPFLFLLGSLIGLTRTLNYLGLDQLLASHLSGLKDIMATNFYLFVVILFAVILLVRSALSINATIVIASSVFLPLANTAGVNMWVVGFIILTFSEVFLLPYQCSYYVLFKNLNGRDPVYRESTFLRFNLWVSLFRLIAIFVSIPVWRAMEIL